MKSLNAITIIFLLLFNLSCKKNKSYKSNPSNNDIIQNTFTHTDGVKILDSNNNPILLKGVAFSNWVWEDEIKPSHHNALDYERVKGMNMNAIRFYLNYKFFEDDAAPYQYKQSGWDYLNQNIAWAKTNGIYLILNMHIPQGGYQSQAKGDLLWTNIENQNRLTALWKTIAEKYKNEKTIIGFGLVNEIVPTSSLSQWQQLAQRLVDEIRTVDKNHIVFVEKPIFIKGQNTENADYNFPIINDNNKVYEFHTYEPYYFTHQLLSWTGLPDGGKYPDDNNLNYEDAIWYNGIFNNPKLPSGNNDWQQFDGIKYKVTDANMKLGVPVLVGANVTGKVYFDNIILKEYDTAGVFVRDVLDMNLNDVNGWDYWSSNNTGTSAVATNTGVGDNTSIYINENTLDCNLSNYRKIFLVKQGYYYKISGWMKGENVSTQANCSIRIDFLNTTKPIFGRNKQYMEYAINKYTTWAQQKSVPVFMGEFGAGNPCFQNGKGGLQFVNDVIDITKASGIHFTYHAYHESSFGIYQGDNELPDATDANQPLINLFTEKLKK
jgi:endoglucanase